MKQETYTEQPKFLDNHNIALLMIKSVPPDMKFWVEQTAEECGCTLGETLWISKSNEYVVYDYEPFVSDSFRVQMLIEARTLEQIQFFKYLYDSRMDYVTHFEDCLEVNQMITFNLKEEKSCGSKQLVN